MIPILLDLHFIKIYTFGVFLAFALVWALFLLYKHVKLTSYKEEDMFDMVFIGLLGGLVVSRLLYVVSNFKTIGFDIAKIILVNGYPGMSLIGFIAGFFGIMALLFFRAGFEIKKGLDYLVTPLFVAMSFSKIGSLLGGVDVGVKTKLPIGVTYVGFDGLRHIVGFYEAILFLICALIARQILFKTRRQILAHGTTFFWFLFSFGGVTVLLDNLKQNHLYLGGLSVNLVSGIILVVVSTIYFLVTSRQLILTRIIKLFSKIKPQKVEIKNADPSDTKTNRRSPKKIVSKKD